MPVSRKINYKELRMKIDLTADALEALKAKVVQKESGQEIRIYLAGVGCGGGGVAKFSLALDALQPGDTAHDAGGVTLYYDKLVPLHVNYLAVSYKPSQYENEQFTVKGDYRPDEPVG